MASSALPARAAFLSTLPVRGATSGSGTFHLPQLISIHAPREGSDGPPARTTSRGSIFLSTLPVRGATLS